MIVADELHRPPLDARSKYLRSLVIDGLSAGRGHVGSPLSVIKVLRVLYDDVLRVRSWSPIGSSATVSS
jgi:transketolase N-terminal domain/subunit